MGDRHMNVNIKGKTEGMTPAEISQLRDNVLQVVEDTVQSFRAFTPQSCQTLPFRDPPQRDPGDDETDTVLEPPVGECSPPSNSGEWATEPEEAALPEDSSTLTIVIGGENVVHLHVDGPQALGLTANLTDFLAELESEWDYGDDEEEWDDLEEEDD